MSGLLPGPAVPKQGAKAQQFVNAVGMGRVPGWSLVRVFGRNDDIGATAEDIWHVGGTIVYPTVAAQMSIVSTDANDSYPSGSGLRELRVYGLLDGYVLNSEVVQLSGLTPANTAQSYLRYLTCEPVSAGTSDGNEGTITGSIGGNPMFLVHPGEGVSHNSHYTVPAGYRAWLEQVTTWQAKDSAAEVTLQYRPFGKPWHVPGHFLSYRNQETMDLYSGFVFEEKTDIKFQAVPAAGGAGVDQSIFYTMMLEEL